VTFIILKNKKYIDKSGETVWFPRDDRPYFDDAIRKTFHSVKEKAEYMNSHNIISTGESEETARKQKKIIEEIKKDGVFGKK